MAKAERVSNCNAHPPVQEQQIDPNDNAYHCPVIGSWVSLSKDPDGNVICSFSDCPNWREDPENP